MSKVVSVRIDNTLLEEIDEMATTINTNRSELIRLALKYFIKKIKDIDAIDPKNAFIKILNELECEKSKKKIRGIIGDVYG